MATKVSQKVKKCLLIIKMDYFVIKYFLIWKRQAKDNKVLSQESLILPIQWTKVFTEGH